MKILPFLESDLKFIPAIQPEGWNNITPYLEYYLRNHRFCHPIKVMDGSELVGIGTHIEHNDVAWLGHIAVLKTHRNKGIGQLITETLVEKAQKKCDTIYLIATDMGATVYKKSGFEKETDYLMFREVKINPNSVIDPKIVPYNDRMKPQIIELDREVSGENRTFQIEENLQGTFVYLQEENVEGCYLPSFGDGLIIASSASAGLALMKLRFSNHNMASFPVDNQPAAAFLYQNHGPESATLERMVLGKKRAWKPTHIFNRVGGNMG